jgi:hypothetical protein
MPNTSKLSKANKAKRLAYLKKLKEQQAAAPAQDAPEPEQQVAEGTGLRLGLHLLLYRLSHIMVLSYRRLRQHQLPPSTQSLSLARGAQGGSQAARSKITW